MVGDGANLGKVPISFIVVIMQTFMYVNAPSIFGKFATQAKEIILLYMVMTFSFSILSLFTFGSSQRQQLKGAMNKPFLSSLLNFFISFFISMGIFYLLPMPITGSIFKPLSIMQSEVITFLPYMLLFAFVIAYTEELVFRQIVPQYIGRYMSAGVFALFHWYAYSGGISSLIFAFGMGLILDIIFEKAGLSASTGVHASWNLALLGAI